MHWHHSGSPCKTKFKQTLSVWTVMCMVFLDRWVIFFDFLTRGEIMIAERYFETLQKLQWAIQNKQRMMFIASVVLQHVIMLSHTRLDGQHISWRSAVRCLIIHPIARTLCPWFSSFLTPQEIPVWSASAFSEWQKGRDECHTVVPIPGGWLLRNGDKKNWSHDMTNV